MFDSIKARTNAPTLRTALHVYRFDTRTAEGKQDYLALCNKLTALGLKCFEADGVFYIPEHAGPIELQTVHLFDDQWNTEKHRVFDWAQSWRKDGIKTGHYLEQTEEMRSIRAEVTKCGYCGAYGTVADGPTFCTACVGSEFLKPTELHLLRMVPIRDTWKQRAPLTAEESAEYSLRYHVAQGEANTKRAIERREAAQKRIRARRDEAIRKAQQDVRAAEVRFTAEQWLFDHGAEPAMVENCIYYKHTEQFSFGWRDALNEQQVAELLEVLGSEFPYDYEIKTTYRGSIGSK